MSSGGQIAGGIIGAVVGFYVGGPAGAFQGAALGIGIGGYLDPPKGPTVSGPRLSDLTVQTSTYGTFVPRVYGTIAVHGNLLWLENNKLKETVRKEEQGGKGGGSSTTVKTYTYSATFALAICQGPIVGVRRIWCGDKLIYNAGSDDFETIISSNKNASGWRIYLGTDNQEPDHRYQSDVGTANASSFRGIAYIVFDDFELADYSNTLQVAQFKVEVVTAADFVGFRKIVDAQSGITYARSGAGGSFASGLPYIYKAESTTFISAASNVSYRHNSSGIGSNNGFATSKNLLPGATDPLSGIFYCGHVSDDKVLWLNVTNLTYVDGVDLGFYDPEVGFTQISLSGLGIDVANKKINGATVSGDGNLFAVSFCSDSLDIGNNNISDVYVIDSNLSNVSQYLTSSGISISNALCCGRTAQRLFVCSALSNSGRYIYTADGADFRVTKWSLSNGSMSIAESFDDTIISGGLFSKPGIIENDGIVYIAAGTGFYIFIASDVISPDLVPLADIIHREIALSGTISEIDVDVSLLSSAVRGYRVAGGTIRAALEPLQGAFPFDVIPSGYKIKCVPRGQASVADISWEDLGAAGGEQGGDILQQSREMDTQLPARTNITYLDAAREYAESEQYAERINTPAINRVDRELPLVINADEAAGVAEVLQNLAWLERNDLAFSLPPAYLHLEASDVVTLSMPDATYEVRLTDVSYAPGGRLGCKAKPNRAALYTPNATGGEVPGPDGQVPLAGDSLFIPLDIPVVDETTQNSSGFIGAMTGYNDSWPGALAIRSVDDGQTWADIQGYAGKASVAICLTTLPASSCTLIDARSLSISSISGSWSSITRDQMLSGQHYAAYGLDGRWEIVRYQSADLQPDGTYLLSGFIRGERGTEWATGLHQVGDWFVLLDDPDLAFIGSSVESIGVPAVYRGVTSGGSYEEAADVPFTYRGANLECLSPVYPKGSRDGSGNFAGSFTRRSRVTGTWWTTGAPTPVGEASEAYEIDVMSGSTVIRTISATSPSFTYSAADQTTDFGSPQSSITFRIYQLSAVVGRGYPLEVTL